MQFIKTVGGGILLVALMGVAVEYKFNQPEVVIKETATTTVELIEEVIEEDVIEKANRELERINQELDTEETRLLVEIEEREVRLEQIRETRTSF